MDKETVNSESRATENRYIKYCAYILIFSATGFLLNIMPSVTSALYTTSAIVFTTIQMKVLEGSENSLTKYIRIALKVATVCFILAGLLMMEDTHMLLFDFLPLKVWLNLCHDKWGHFLFLAFVIELYASDKLYKSLELCKKYKESEFGKFHNLAIVGSILFVIIILGFVFLLLLIENDWIY